MTEPGLAVPLLVGSGAYAVWSDLRYRRLSNALALLVAMLGLAVTFFAAGPESLIGHVLHALAALAAGMALFALGMIGGGDAKYYAGVSAWFGIESWTVLMASVSLAGLLLASYWLTVHRLRSQGRQLASDSDFSKLPFGVAIATGAVTAAWWVS